MWLSTSCGYPFKQSLTKTFLYWKLVLLPNLLGESLCWRNVFCPCTVLCVYSAPTTMENGFKSHVSYFTQWQAPLALANKWWFSKVRRKQWRRANWSASFSRLLTFPGFNLLSALLEHWTVLYFFFWCLTVKVRGDRRRTYISISSLFTSPFCFSIFFPLTAQQQEG